jgi:hypothetical protein
MCSIAASHKRGEDGGSQCGRSMRAQTHMLEIVFPVMIVFVCWWGSVGGVFETDGGGERGRGCNAHQLGVVSPAELLSHSMPLYPY